MRQLTLYFCISQQRPVVDICLHSSKVYGDLSNTQQNALLHIHWTEPKIVTENTRNVKLYNHGNMLYTSVHHIIQVVLGSV